MPNRNIGELTKEDAVMVPLPQMFVLPPPQGAIGGMTDCSLGGAVVVSLLLGLLLSAAFGIIWSVIRRRWRAPEEAGAGATVQSAIDVADRKAA